MPGTTLKRAATTIGVLAGLLAAAAPAGAQLVDGSTRSAVLVQSGLRSDPGPVSINSSVDVVPAILDVHAEI